MSSGYILMMLVVPLVFLAVGTGLTAAGLLYFFRTVDDDRRAKLAMKLAMYSLFVLGIFVFYFSAWSVYQYFNPVIDPYGF